MGKYFWAAFALAALLLAACPAAAAPLVKVGAPFPPAAFAGPKEPAARAYLGLKPGQDLDPARIPARLVIVEFFNMYCTHCQREAPAVNRLYEMIQKKGWGEEIKLVGIGAKNGAFEVEVFAKHYKVPFPLVPDPELRSQGLLDKIYTPHFVVILRPASGGNKVIYSKSGHLPPLDKFLAGIAGQAGLK